MDRALDEIVAERYRGGRIQGRRLGRRPERNHYPREGIRKDIFGLIIIEKTVLNTLRVGCGEVYGEVYHLSKSANPGLSSIYTVDAKREWVHDKFDDNTGRRTFHFDRRFSPSPDHDPPSAKLRVENLHYDLTEDDLDDLFNRIGPVLELSLIYDRAGRSEGIAYVTYKYSHDAKKAIQEFDGANAKGQPIRLISIPSGPSGGRRNAAPTRNRSLFDRVTNPARKPRSDSGFRRSDMSGLTQNNIDRYVPGKYARSRSPPRRRREGRRIGEKFGGGRGGERLARDGRPKKTQEELDADMEDYWGGKNRNTIGIAPSSTTAAIDDEMRE